MATYYVDPENHTGAAIDSVGGGLSAAAPYLTFSYAVNDINVTHSKATYGDTVKMIGTYAPTDSERTALESALLTYGAYFIWLSDGATAFGTSATSRATISGANATTHVIYATSVTYMSVIGFELVAANGGNTLVGFGHYALFEDIYVNQTDAGYSFVHGRVGWRCVNSYFKVKLTSAWSGTGGPVAAAYTQHTVNNCIFDLEGKGFTGLGLCASNANSSNTFTNNTVYIKGGASGFASNASNIFVANNLFICDVFNSNSCGVVAWINFGTARIVGNHFENLQQAAGYTGTSASPTLKSTRVMMTDNTYFNVPYVGVNDPNATYYSDWSLVRNNVDLGTSGVIDAANGDLRPSSARVGSSNLASMPTAGANWQLKTMAGNGVGIQSPTQYRPFG